MHNSAILMSENMHKSANSMSENMHISTISMSENMHKPLDNAKNGGYNEFRGDIC